MIEQTIRGKVCSSRDMFLWNLFIIIAVNFMGDVLYGWRSASKNRTTKFLLKEIDTMIKLDRV